MGNVSVSVIIPVYNVEKYLRECLDSVLNQTVPFDEIIIVNDGSIDGSGEICGTYKQNNPKIILINQINAGLSEARNNGLKIARGDFIVFVDSDDLVSSRMCESIKEILNCKERYDVVYYGADIKSEIPIKISEEEYVRAKWICNKKWDSFESLKVLFPAGYQMSVCMAAYKRCFLKRQNIRFLKGILYEDRYFSLRVSTEAEAVIYIQDRLYIRRFRSGSIVTSDADRKKFEDVLYGHSMEWNYIKNNVKWKNESGLTQYFVLCGALMMYQNDVSNQNMKIDRERYLYAFFKEWLKNFNLSIMSINELCLYLFLIKQVAISMNEKWNQLFSKVGGLRILKIKLYDLVCSKCKMILMKQPFDKQCKIGIYGRGEHTTCMLQLYETLIGDIQAELFYIETDSKSIGESVKNIGEITVEEVKETDYFLLSSKIYQKDMYLKLKEHAVPEHKIIKLYTMKDAVDFVMIHSSLFE